MQDSEFRIVYGSEQDLRRLAAGHANNAFILNGKERSLKDPLPYLFTGFFNNDPSLPQSHFLTLRGDDLIVASATFVPNLKSRFCEDDVLYLTQVSTRPGFRGRGFAPALIKNVFALAAKTGFAVKLTHFEEDGRNHLALQMPRLHAATPSLKVYYFGMNSAVTAEKPYRMVPKNGLDPVPSFK